MTLPTDRIRRRAAARELSELLAAHPEEEQRLTQEERDLLVEALP